MEVHVRNVPSQSTKNGLSKFLKPHFANLSIRSVYCLKQRDKTFASLTFLNPADGERFLAQHGQTRLPLANVGNRVLGYSGPHMRQHSTTAVKLFFLSQPIYCELSTRSPDPQLLRVLEKEEKDRQKKTAELAIIHPHDRASHFLPLSFECESISCGIQRSVASYHSFQFNKQLLIFRIAMLIRTWYLPLN